jgi:hypothetical protein
MEFNYEEGKFGRVVSRRTVLRASAALTAALGLAACGMSKSSSSSSASTAGGSDVRSIAADAYLYGYPLVLADATRASPTNQLVRNGSPADARSRGIVAPQVDTLFALAWLDLRPEPMVIQMPAVDGKRFWLTQLVDAWTNTVHNPSSVRPNIAAGRAAPPFTYAITGPGWSGTLPNDLTRLAMPTGTALLANRIQFDGAADLDSARALQAQVKLMPLSAWITDPNTTDTTSASGTVRGPSMSPLMQVNAMDGHTFFNRMTALLAANPAPPGDADVLSRFASIGITAGGTVDNLDAGVLDAAVQDGQDRIAGYTNPHARTENGWSVATNLGSYGADYPLRANTAKVLFGASVPQDTLYPMLDNIDAGTTDAPRRYRIRFEPGQLPPVDAFWSISAYDADHYFIANPDNRYAVGHQIPVVPGPDGAVEIALQNAKPGPEVPTGNWLPIPASGTFSLIMRLYAPHDAAVAGTWQPPPLTPAGSANPIGPAR